jgi:hypothetical protein
MEKEEYSGQFNTAEYFYNMKFFERKSKQNKRDKREEINNHLTKEDVRFYRKRIMHYCHEMLYNADNTIDNADSELEHSFQSFLLRCIRHFQQSDLDDLIKRENEIEIDIETNNLVNVDETTTTITETKMPNCNEKIFTLNKNKNKSTSDLMQFVVKKELVEEKPTVFIPIKKEYNLYAPEFRKKGIPQKFIDIHYDEKKNIQTEDLFEKKEKPIIKETETSSSFNEKEEAIEWRFETKDDVFKLQSSCPK